MSDLNKKTKNKTSGKKQKNKKGISAKLLAIATTSIFGLNYDIIGAVNTAISNTSILINGGVYKTASAGWDNVDTEVEGNDVDLASYSITVKMQNTNPLNSKPSIVNLDDSVSGGLLIIENNNPGIPFDSNSGSQSYVLPDNRKFTIDGKVGTTNAIDFNVKDNTILEFAESNSNVVAGNMCLFSEYSKIIFKAGGGNDRTLFGEVYSNPAVAPGTKGGGGMLEINVSGATTATINDEIGSGGRGIKNIDLIGDDKDSTVRFANNVLAGGVGEADNDSSAGYLYINMSKVILDPGKHIQIGASAESLPTTNGTGGGMGTLTINPSFETKIYIGDNNTSSSIYIGGNGINGAVGNYNGGDGNQGFINCITNTNPITIFAKNVGSTIWIGGYGGAGTGTGSGGAGGFGYLYTRSPFTITSENNKSWEVYIGGYGGDGTATGYGGNAGGGTIQLLSSSSSLNETYFDQNNYTSFIFGGRGGDGGARTGNGGGITISAAADSSMTLNSGRIIGGSGGSATSNLNTAGGNGGNSVIELNGGFTINDASGATRNGIVVGGNGGIGSGNARSGYGGYGMIKVENNSSLDGSIGKIVLGGTGGSGLMARGGSGYIGVVTQSSIRILPTKNSFSTSVSLVLGGNGGISSSNLGTAGNGGNGLFALGADFTTSADVNMGGKGGDSSGNDSIAGSGGVGILGVEDSVNTGAIVSINNNSKLTIGGDGGNVITSGIGGAGGRGNIDITSTNNILFTGSSAQTIKIGGNGGNGDGANGKGGAGGVGTISIYSPGLNGKTITIEQAFALGGNGGNGQIDGVLGLGSGGNGGDGNITINTGNSVTFKKELTLGGNGGIKGASADAEKVDGMGGAGQINIDSGANVLFMGNVNIGGKNPSGDSNYGTLRLKEGIAEFRGDLNFGNNEGSIIEIGENADSILRLTMLKADRDLKELRGDIVFKSNNSALEYKSDGAAIRVLVLPRLMSDTINLSKGNLIIDLNDSNVLVKSASNKGDYDKEFAIGQIVQFPSVQNKINSIKIFNSGNSNNVAENVAEFQNLDSNGLINVENFEIQNLLCTKSKHALAFNSASDNIFKIYGNVNVNIENSGILKLISSSNSGVVEFVGNVGSELTKLDKIQILTKNNENSKAIIRGNINVKNGIEVETRDGNLTLSTNNNDVKIIGDIVGAIGSKYNVTFDQNGKNIDFRGDIDANANSVQVKNSSVFGETVFRGKSDSKIVLSKGTILSLRPSSPITDWNVDISSNNDRTGVLRINTTDASFTTNSTIGAIGSLRGLELVGNTNNQAVITGPVNIGIIVDPNRLINASERPVYGLNLQRNNLGEPVTSAAIIAALGVASSFLVAVATLIGSTTLVVNALKELGSSSVACIDVWSGKQNFGDEFTRMSLGSYELSQQEFEDFMNSSTNYLRNDYVEGIVVRSGNVIFKDKVNVSLYEIVDIMNREASFMPESLRVESGLVEFQSEFKGFNIKIGTENDTDAKVLFTGDEDLTLIGKDNILGTVKFSGSGDTNFLYKASDKVIKFAYMYAEHENNNATFEVNATDANRFVTVDGYVGYQGDTNDPANRNTVKEFITSGPGSIMTTKHINVQDLIVKDSSTLKLYNQASDSDLITKTVSGSGTLEVRNGDLVDGIQFGGPNNPLNKLKFVDIPSTFSTRYDKIYKDFKFLNTNNIEVSSLRNIRFDNPFFDGNTTINLSGQLTINSGDGTIKSLSGDARSTLTISDCGDDIHISNVGTSSSPFQGTVAFVDTYFKTDNFYVQNVTLDSTSILSSGSANNRMGTLTIDDRATIYLNNTGLVTDSFIAKGDVYLSTQIESVDTNTKVMNIGGLTIKESSDIKGDVIRIEIPNLTTQVVSDIVVVHSSGNVVTSSTPIVSSATSSSALGSNIPVTTSIDSMVKVRYESDTGNLTTQIDPSKKDEVASIQTNQINNSILNLTAEQLKTVTDKIDVNTLNDLKELDEVSQDVVSIFDQAMLSNTNTVSGKLGAVLNSMNQDNVKSAIAKEIISRIDLAQVALDANNASTSQISDRVMQNIDFALSDNIDLVSDFDQPGSAAELQSYTPSGDDEKSESRIGLWTKGFIGNGNQKAYGDNLGFKSNLKGLTIGIDSDLYDKAIVGAAITLANSNSKLKGYRAGDKITADSTIFSIYGSYKINNKLFASFVGSYGSNKIDIREKRMKLDTTYGQSKSSYSSDLYNLNTKLTYKHSIDKLSIYPSIGINLSRINDPSYKERDTDLNKTLSSKQSTVASLLIGAKFAYNFDEIVPEAHVNISQKIHEKGSRVGYKLDGMPDWRYSEEVKKAAKMSFNVGGSVNYKNDIFSIGLGVDANFAKKYQGYQGSMNLRVNM